MEWMFVCPPNSNVESLSHSVSIFGDEDSKAVIKVKWVHKGGALILYDQCPYKKRYQGILSLSLSLSLPLSLSLSPSSSLHFSLSSSFSLSLSLSMWGPIKKLAVLKPGRDLLGETNPAIHFASRTDRRQMSLVCWSCPVWDCVTGVQDGKDSMYQQAQNKFLGNHMGVRRRFRRE